MIKFILNNKEIQTQAAAGTLLLDFIRYQQNLKGTKIGCREGDCGACVVLIGELKNEELHYRSFTACLTPLGNVHGKHVVTIEGINEKELNTVQQAMFDESATQCGFCTPGFVMSLTGFCISNQMPSTEAAIAAIDGNICRCTGYKSIENAAFDMAAVLQNRAEEDALSFAIKQKMVPAYFADIKKRLQLLSLSLNGELKKDNIQVGFLGGGTDLYVQKPEELKEASLQFLFNHSKNIYKEDDKCIIGPAATVTDLLESPVMQQHFPQLKRFVRLVSSTPIRNMATIAGNFVNASPIGDFTIFFLALDAQLVLSDGKKRRELPLRQLYKGYKSLDKKPEEMLEKIWFQLPGKNQFFNFEKVSKRTHLDIASVNSAMQLTFNERVIISCHLSAGGVAPVPKYLEKTSAFLKGKKISEELIAEAVEVVQTEISPISDARGTERYKRLLLNQLVKAHFITLFPWLQPEKLLSV